MAQSMKATTSSQDRNVLVITVATNASGAGKKLTAIVDGKLAEYTTVGADTPTIAAAGLAAALVIALGGGYVVEPVAGVITVTRTGVNTDANEIQGQVVGTDVGFQTITIDSQGMGRRLVADATAAVLGGGAAADGGWDVDQDSAKRLPSPVRLHARLTNGTGVVADQKGRWRLSCYSKTAGWFDHPTFGTRTITEGTGEGWTEDVVEVELYGVERVRPYLLDNATPGANLAAGVLFDCWGIVL